MHPPHKVVSALALVVLASGWVGGERAGQQSDIFVKARYIGLLSEYTVWPTPAQAKNKSHPFVVGVLGVSPFDTLLRDIYDNQTIQGRPVKISYFGSTKNIGACDALFICESETDHLSEILKGLSGKPVLTIGDTPGFSQKGIMINFVLLGDRVGFEVNLLALKGTGFSMSSHVLKMARIVE